MRQAYFLHLDDELERVIWIPQVLRTEFYTRNPENFSDADNLVESDDGKSCSFSLISKEYEIKINYRFFIRKEELFNVDDSHIRSSIIILDLMGPEESGVYVVGIDVLDSLLKKGANIDNIYYLTAFETVANQQLNGRIPEDHILMKPLDAELMAKILLKSLNINI